jgi:hypothetical protein
VVAIGGLCVDTLVAEIVLDLVPSGGEITVVVSVGVVSDVMLLTQIHGGVICLAIILMVANGFHTFQFAFGNHLATVTA